MHIDRRLLNWGVFLVILGAVPLAAHAGLIPTETLGRAWQLWPLILIGAGIGLILSRTPVAFLGGLLVASTFGIMLGGLIAGGISLGGIGCGATDAATLAPDQHGTFGPRATVDLRLSCGSLRVAASGTSEWTFGASADGRGRPSVDVAADRLAARSPGGVVFPPFTNGSGSRWAVGLPAGTGLDLQVKIDAGDATLALAGLTVTGLTVDANAATARVDLRTATAATFDLTVNAGDLRVRLPATSTSGTVSANAASVHLCAAPGTDLRLVTGHSSVSSDNFASRGLVRTGDTWAAPGATGTVVSVHVVGNAASIMLDDPEGCG
jgi:hypothetical protein